MDDDIRVRRMAEVEDRNVLKSLGLGPDTVLMNDPKLFVDARLLACLIVELEGKLGVEDTRTALFQIGLSHGFRDAQRSCEGEFVAEGQATVGQPCTSTSVPMELSVANAGPPTGRHEILGHWPERHEAGARLARAGRSDEPACYLSSGYTSGWLSGTQEMDLIAVEIECAASGASHCRFRALEIDDWRAQDESRLIPTDSISFAQFRASATLHTAASDQQPELDGEGEFDPNERAVHIWGPVMILPFLDTDEALCTLEMLGRDPTTCDVRAVVIDLRHQPLDDDLSAAGLERILETVERWGAEVILTGVSPLSEAVVYELEVSHLLIRKDLPNAIATAFQIADAQRHLA
jgi:hypothetical protein